MIQQVEITLKSKSRGFHLVTSEILSQLPKLPKTGIVNIFCKHTSCGLSINENADPDVRVDMETIFNRLVPENRPEYEHTLEGADDMPAHAKSTLSGVSLTIPITNGRLNMGTWQARNLLLRVPELRWGKKTGRNNHRRVIYDFFRTCKEQIQL